jgi:tRNA (guanine10-N2)-dimethyltransferase
MTYIYRLAGENLEIAEAELKGFLKSQEVEEEPDRQSRIAETESEPEMLKRLALTHEVSRKIAEIDPDNLQDTEIDYRLEGSFAVNCKIIEGEEDPQKIEEQLGEKLDTEESTVDLENPDTEVTVYVAGEKIVIGELIQDIPRGKFQDRTNEKRPFSSPVSLDPVLARVLVNLAEIPAGGKVLDPFCGTGGILIEAGLCGTLPCGADVKEEMVKGTRKNLEEYGIINHDIRKLDAEKVLKGFETGFDAVITDLPYGKASKIEGETEKKFLNLIEEFDGKAVFMYDKPKLGKFKADFEVYIHKNLTRYIFVS